MIVVRGRTDSRKLHHLYCFTADRFELYQLLITFCGSYYIELYDSSKSSS